MNPEVTQILADLSKGDDKASAKLFRVVYTELRRLASAQMARMRPSQTLQPTAVVHEAYFKLVGSGDPGWNGRGHFFGAAAQAMREILVDHVRRRSAAKRGGGVPNEELGPEMTGCAEGMGIEDALTVHAALKRLEVEHPRRGKIVVMRYFGGLSEEEIAEALGVTTRTVEREWRFARAYLHDAIKSEVQ
jgi:RNA polymerase sigma factor (TIGR02999 family)